jgi:hypothetical protein
VGGAGSANDSHRELDAYVPLRFAPGEAYQFDWSHEMSFTFAAAAYNLVRLPKLLAKAG